MTYYKTLCLNRFLIELLLRALLVLIFLNGCGAPQPHVADNPASQRFWDVTGKLFPRQDSPLKQSVFFHANLDGLPDLLVLKEVEPGRPQLQAFLNHKSRGFRQRGSGRWIEKLKDPIIFLTAADLNFDGGDDLILLIETGGKVTTQILFNNKKGYFYSREKEGLYSLWPGIEKVISVDIDHDGDRDLFYFGQKVLNAKGKPSHFQARLLINNGEGRMEDLTVLLLPRLPSGIRDASFVDYNGDGVVDVFLVYGKGQNRLLLNDGVGKFVDRTSSHIPHILDVSLHADWADFDGDGDNDILVANQRVDKHYRAYPGETLYFLENTGRGHFKKRSNKMLPRLPSYKVYLLDANGNTRTDALILTSKGVYYLQGRGRWEFVDETERRLPRFRFFQEMSFADISRDGFLDLFALSPTLGRCRLWLNRFD